MPIGKSKKKSKVEPEPAAPNIPQEPRKPKFTPEYDFKTFLKERDFLTGLEEVMMKEGKKITQDHEEFPIKLATLKTSVRYLNQTF